MKAISLWQPWAQLIIDGRKLHETRDWNTDYRGRLAIHAAKKTDHMIRTAIEEFQYNEKDLAFGAIIGIVDLCWIRQMEKNFIGNQPLMELAYGDWQPGRYAWRMRVLCKFDNPIPTKGHQGFFEWKERPWTTIKYS